MTADVGSITADDAVKKPRVQAIDALRGLALIGMLLVHFQYYVHGGGWWSDRANDAVDVFAVDRFYPLFAFLFGAGFALQFSRWEQRPGFVKKYLRRLAALMVIAIVVIAFIGYRVLESYAFWGLALLLLRRWSNRALILAVVLFAFTRPVAQFAVWQWDQRHLTLEESNAKVVREMSASPEFHREEDELRDAALHRQLAVHRLRDMLHSFQDWHTYLPHDPLMMMVLGVLAVRIRIFQEPQRYRRLLIGMIAFGAIEGIGSVLLVKWLVPESPSLRLMTAFRTLGYTFFDERFQGLAYASALLLFTSRAGASGRLTKLLAAPGRLSLTNYVIQIALLEGLCGSSHPFIWLDRWKAMAGVVIVYGAQIWFSQWWMARYRYGPLEWLWRSATFARWEPLRRERAQATAA